MNEFGQFVFDLAKEAAEDIVTLPKPSTVGTSFIEGYNAWREQKALQASKIGDTPVRKRTASRRRNLGGTRVIKRTNQQKQRSISRKRENQYYYNTERLLGRNHVQEEIQRQAQAAYAKKRTYPRYDRNAAVFDISTNTYRFPYSRYRRKKAFPSFRNKRRYYRKYRANY